MGDFSLISDLYVTDDVTTGVVSAVGDALVDVGDQLEMKKFTHVHNISSDEGVKKEKSPSVLSLPLLLHHLHHHAYCPVLTHSI